MPVQVSKDKFIRFNYDPDYMEGQVYDNIRTLQKDVITPEKYSIADRLDIKLDGGNVVKGKKKVIITDLVFSENNKAWTRAELTNELKGILDDSEVVIIPLEPGDFTGHADGLVRFLTDDTVLVSAHSNKQNIKKQFVYRSYTEKLYGALAWAGLDMVQVPCFFSDRKYKDPFCEARQPDYTALGNYINYLQVRNYVFLPQYYKEGRDLGAPENIVQEMDQKAVKKFKELFGEGNVIPVDCYDIALRGGVLNCMTWNVLEP